MKIVNIIGGLGNQMFQYAFALFLKERFPNEEVRIDVSHFNHIFLKKWKTANLHNGYELSTVFPNLSLKRATPIQLMRTSYYIPNYLLSRFSRRYLPKRKSEYIESIKQHYEYHDDVYAKDIHYYEGIWGSVHYYLPIRDKLRIEFAHGSPNKVNDDYIQAIKKEASVGIHVRRGDYLQERTMMGICDISYYQRSIEEMLSDHKSHTFYIFSDDREWCENNIVPLVHGNQVRIVHENCGMMSCWDMFLMTYCKDLIIANSTFSWWGAFLNNRNGRIIAPQKWFNRDAIFDVWQDEWIKK